MMIKAKLKNSSNLGKFLKIYIDKPKNRLIYTQKNFFSSTIIRKNDSKTENNVKKGKRKEKE